MTSVLSLSRVRPRRTDIRAISHAATLAEVFSPTALDAGGIGFVMSTLAQGTRPVLWVQDRLSCKETGLPYLPYMHMTAPVLRVHLSHPADVLQAMEDGLHCASLGAVIGEIWGEPSVLDFTATKRLALRSEANAIPCWLLRRAASPNLSAARNRWRVASLPAKPDQNDTRAPGDPRWHIELFRSRQAQPGTWVATHDRAAGRVDFSAAVRDGAVAAGNGAGWQRSAR
jgi:protein ImuA